MLPIGWPAFHVSSTSSLAPIAIHGRSGYGSPRLLTTTGTPGLSGSVSSRRRLIDRAGARSTVVTYTRSDESIARTGSPHEQTSVDGSNVLPPSIDRVERTCGSCTPTGYSMYTTHTVPALS